MSRPGAIHAPSRPTPSAKAPVNPVEEIDEEIFDTPVDDVVMNEPVNTPVEANDDAFTSGTAASSEAPVKRNEEESGKGFMSFFSDDDDDDDDGFGILSGFGDEESDDDAEIEIPDSSLPPPAEDTYEGARNNYGQPHGKGLMRYASGDIYNGFWSYGKWLGKGVYISSDGHTYTGMFRDFKDSDSLELIDGGTSVRGSMRYGAFYPSED